MAYTQFRNPHHTPPPNIAKRIKSVSPEHNNQQQNANYVYQNSLNKEAKSDSKIIRNLNSNARSLSPAQRNSSAQSRRSVLSSRTSERALPSFICHLDLVEKVPSYIQKIQFAFALIETLGEDIVKPTSLTYTAPLFKMAEQTEVALNEGQVFYVKRSSPYHHLYIETRFTNTNGLVGKGWSLHKLYSQNIQQELLEGAYRTPFYPQKVTIDEFIKTKDVSSLPNTLSSFVLCYQIRHTQQELLKNIARNDYKMQDLHKSNFYRELLAQVEKKQDIDLQNKDRELRERREQHTFLPRLSNLNNNSASAEKHLQERNSVLCISSAAQYKKLSQEKSPPHSQDCVSNNSVVPVNSGKQDLPRHAFNNQSTNIQDILNRRIVSVRPASKNGELHVRGNANKAVESEVRDRWNNKLINDDRNFMNKRAQHISNGMGVKVFSVPIRLNFAKEEAQPQNI